jgi:hypothetical protein
MALGKLTLSDQVFVMILEVAYQNKVIGVFHHLK